MYVQVYRKFILRPYFLPIISGNKAPDPARKAGKRFMKKILSMILCVCLFAGATAFAEEEAAAPGLQVSDEMRTDEETGDNSILLKIWNRSGLEFSYLRFDFYVGEEYRGLVASCPDEGEDFYRAPYEPGSAEELKDLRIVFSYGISDLPAEDAILEIMKGNPGEEHEIGAPELVPECGKVYHLILADVDGEIRLVTVEEAAAEPAA